MPNQPRGLLHHALNILRIIVLPAQDDHVLQPAANKQFAVLQKSHVAGAQEPIVIWRVIHQPRAKLLQR